MKRPRQLPLAPQFTSEVDGLPERDWHEQLHQFSDANIYQTWPYAEVIWGLRNTNHLVLRRNGITAALAQVRVFKLPFVKLGIAYVRWGPIWRRSTEVDLEVFRQAIRALRNEFTCKRGLVLRIFPALFESEPFPYTSIMSEEGFCFLEGASLKATILMDLRPPLEALREGMMSHWKRELKVAERKELEIIEGNDGELFRTFIEIYKEMVSRKKFVEPNDINQFRLIQARLPNDLKMQIMLCKLNDDICSGLICSAIGNTAIYLFGATSNSGMKSRGSYLLHWKLVERLKSQGIATYDLNGINPKRNPGTYKFKRDFAGNNGREVRFLGQFESHPGNLGKLCVDMGESIKTTYRSSKELWLREWSTKLHHG